jgi:signal transduction histidine kinase
MQSHLDQSVPLAGLAVQFHVSGQSAPLALSAEIRQHLYLIFKEAVTNALRHASGTTELRIRFERDPASGLTLETLDNGMATPSATAEVGMDMGLRNMRQRAATIGATLQAGPRPDGRGYRVWVRVPR